MDAIVVECEAAERDGCACKRGPTLAILSEVHRGYEKRLALVERVGGNKKHQMQLEVLRSWVSDLVGQNTLLARAVEDLEEEATTRLFLERRRHTERERKCSIGDEKELKILNDTLQKENTAKEREIRRLNKDVQHYEQAIMKLRNEMSLTNHYEPGVEKKDAEVMVSTCCTGNECGDLEPVKDCVELKNDTTLEGESQDRLKKTTGEYVRSLHETNVTLTNELQNQRHMCLALHEQWRAATVASHFKEDIIREMRRQLKQAKNKLKELTSENIAAELNSHECVRRASYDTVTIASVRQPPWRSRGVPSPRGYSDDGNSPRLDVSEDDILSGRVH